MNPVKQFESPDTIKIHPQLTTNLKLYEIKQHTYARSDCVDGIVGYIVAENSKKVYQYLLRNEFIYEYKHDKTLDMEYILQTKGFSNVHELIIHAHGDENVTELFPTIDDDELFSKFSWKIVKQNINNDDVTILKNYGIYIIEYDNITQA